MIIISALMNATQKKRAGMMKEGVELLAATLSKVGAKAISGNSGAASAKETIEMKRLSDRNQALESSQNSDASLSNMASDLISQEMVNLKKESEQAWQEIYKHPFVTNSLLKDWLAADKGERFMNLAATLSPFDSNQLMQCFSPEDTAPLRGMLTDVSSRLKGYSVVLALIRSVQDRLREGPPALSQADFPAIVKSTDEQLAKHLFILNSQTQISLLSLFSVARAQRLLEKQVELFGSEAAATTLQSMAEQEAIDEQNLQLKLAELENILKKEIQSEHDSGNLSHIEDLALRAESFSPKLKAAMSLARSQSEKFAKQFDAKSVTMEHVLSVDLQIIFELIEPLDSEQIAQLMISLNAKGRQTIGSLLKDKMRVTASADFQRLQKSATSFKKAEIEGYSVQTLIIQKLKKMIEEGIVELPKKPISTSAGISLDNRAMQRRTAKDEAS